MKNIRQIIYLFETMKLIKSPRESIFKEKEQKGKNGKNLLWREARELIPKGRSLRWSLSDSGNVGKWCNRNQGKERVSRRV